MNEVIPYQYPESHEAEGLSLKQKLGFTLAFAVLGAVAIRYGKKWISNLKTANADSESLKEGTPQTTAKLIKMCFDNDGFWGTDTVKLRATLTQVKSKDEMNQISAVYHKLYPDNLLGQDMESELQTSELKEMLAIIDAKPQKVGQVVPPDKLNMNWANRMKAAFEKAYGPFGSVDTGNVSTVLQEIPTQKLFINMAKAYEKQFHVPLITDMKAKLKGDYLKYMSIITKKPKGN